MNHPLAVQQIQSGIAGGQQQLADNARQFVADLRQRAFQNRLALTGQGMSGGIGLASTSDGGRALGSLAATRMANSTSTSTTRGGGGLNLGGIGQLASGLGSLGSFAHAAGWITSDPRLKHDYGVVGETKEGIPLHLYHYKGESEDTPLRLGVMSDEVREVKPGAVRKHSSGYDVVDYESALGFE